MPETPHCVVIEWGDGSVTVNGPYPDMPLARFGVNRVALEIWKNFDGPRTRHPDNNGWTLGDDGQDQIDVYVQPMGTPILPPRATTG